MSTHEKILGLMAGCDQHKPMPFSDLLEKSGLQPYTLRMVLYQMQYDIPMQINSIALTRDGSTQEVYWPTGVFKHGIGPQGIVVNIEKSIGVARPQATPAKKPVKPVRRMSPFSTEIKDLICAQPGLTMSEVFGQLNKRAAEYHHVRVATYSLVKLGYIRREGIKRHYRYFPGEQT